MNTISNTIIRIASSTIHLMRWSIAYSSVGTPIASSYTNIHTNIIKENGETDRKLVIVASIGMGNVEIRPARNSEVRVV